MVDLILEKIQVNAQDVIDEMSKLFQLRVFESMSESQLESIEKLGQFAGYIIQDRNKENR